MVSPGICFSFENLSAEERAEREIVNGPIFDNAANLWPFLKGDVIGWESEVVDSSEVDSSSPMMVLSHKI